MDIDDIAHLQLTKSLGCFKDGRVIITFIPSTPSSLLASFQLGDEVLELNGFPPVDVLNWKSQLSYYRDQQECSEVKIRRRLHIGYNLLRPTTDHAQPTSTHQCMYARTVELYTLMGHVWQWSYIRLSHAWQWYQSWREGGNVFVFFCFNFHPIF
jgi:hypothetical protein